MTTWIEQDGTAHTTEPESDQWDRPVGVQMSPGGVLIDFDHLTGVLTYEQVEAVHRYARRERRATERALGMRRYGPLMLWMHPRRSWSIHWGRHRRVAWLKDTRVHRLLLSERYPEDSGDHIVMIGPWALHFWERTP